MTHQELLKQGELGSEVSRHERRLRGLQASPLLPANFIALNVICQGCQR